MYFLDLDARKAADATCDQDALRLLVEGTSALTRAHKRAQKQSLLIRWLLADAANYHWLGYFCEGLLNRPGCISYWSKTKNLRICIPDVHYKQLTPFPHVNYPIETNSARIVAAYRTSYVQSRWRYAEWSSPGCPGWFFRLANTILPKRSRTSFLLRVQPAGLSGPDNQGSLFAQRNEVRDGPMGKITGRNGDTFVVWQ